jgi:hypothetical protein
MSANDKRYDMAASRDWVELVVTPVFGRESDRESYARPEGLAALRERVAFLRVVGFRRGKILGGLGRALNLFRNCPTRRVNVG